MCVCLWWWKFVELSTDCLRSRNPDNELQKKMREEAWEEGSKVPDQSEEVKDQGKRKSF